MQVEKLEIEINLFTETVAKEEVESLKVFRMEALEDIAHQYRIKLARVAQWFNESHPDLNTGLKKTIKNY